MMKKRVLFLGLILLLLSLNLVSCEEAGEAFEDRGYRYTLLITKDVQRELRASIFYTHDDVSDPEDVSHTINAKFVEHDPTDTVNQAYTTTLPGIGPGSMLDVSVKHREFKDASIKSVFPSVLLNISTTPPIEQWLASVVKGEKPALTIQWDASAAVNRVTVDGYSPGNDVKVTAEGERVTQVVLDESAHENWDAWITSIRDAKSVTLDLRPARVDGVRWGHGQFLVESVGEAQPLHAQVQGANP